MIVYLHGFGSSPASAKAQQLKLRATAMGESWYCPQLPVSPKKAVDQVLSYLHTHADKRLTIIGSSLGGLYATWLAEQLGCRAVLLNPVTKVPDHPEQYIGTFNNSENGSDEFKAEYINELADLVLPRITRPERYLLLASTSDEVLNYLDMVHYYQGVQQILLEGDSHRMLLFERYIDVVLDFALQD